MRMKRAALLSILTWSIATYASPEPSDGAYWQWNRPTAYGISAKQAQTVFGQFTHPALMIAGQWPELQLHDKQSGFTVGYLRYHAATGTIFVFTVLPFAIPEEKRVVMSEFFHMLNEQPDFAIYGHYYINPDTGEAGFVRVLASPWQLQGKELAEHWNDCSLYRLYPELQSLLLQNVPPDYLMNSLKKGLPENRLAGNIAEMKRFGSKCQVKMPMIDQGIIRILSRTENQCPIQVNVVQRGRNKDHLSKTSFQVIVSGKSEPRSNVTVRLMFLAVPEGEDTAWYDKLLADAVKYGYFPPFWRQNEPRLIGLETALTWKPGTGVMRVNCRELVPTICEYTADCDATGDYMFQIPVTNFRCDEEQETHPLEKLPWRTVRLVIFGNNPLQVLLRKHREEYFDGSVISGYALYPVTGWMQLHFISNQKFLEGIRK